MTFATPTPHTDSMSQGPHRLVAKWFTMLNPQTRASVVGADATRSTPREGAMGARFETPTPTTNTRCSHDHPFIDVRVPSPPRRNNNITTASLSLSLSCLCSNRVGCDQEDKTRETKIEPNKSNTSSSASDEATTRRRDEQTAPSPTHRLDR